MGRGKSIRIFLADGTVTGIRHGEIVNWTGQAIMSPRKRYPELKEWGEAAKPGVYLLFGVDEESGEPMTYIGESENVFGRLKDHVDKKDFWNEAVLFTNKDENLTKAHAKYLESRLIEAASDAGRYKIENGTAPPLPNLPRGDRAAMEEFYDNLRLLLGALGHKILEPLKGSSMETEVDSAENPLLGLKLSFSGKCFNADGLQTDEGFVVTAGAIINPKIAGGTPNAAKVLREKLEEQNVLVKSGNSLVLNKDLLVGSSSMAASFVAGSSRNGRISWKTNDGKTLKEVEEAIFS